MNNPVQLWRMQSKNKDLIDKKGKILTFTTVYIGPTGFENQTPYILAIAQLENNQKLTTQVVNPKNIKAGAKCRVVIRRLARPKPAEVIDYGPKLEIIS